jgi:O-antigen biosynthesis protein
MLSRLGHIVGTYAGKNFILKNTLKKIIQPHLLGTQHTGIPEITPLHARRSDNAGPRINLLVPSINQAHVFGGISTALSFFEKLAQGAGVRKRIITTDTMPEPEALARFSDYVLVPSTQDSGHDRQIVGLGDRYGKTLLVGEKDYFMATAWWTAHHAQKLAGWQHRTFDSAPVKVIYFIQDFEPGFYPWSSRYVLADSTYRWNHPQVAVFNSSLLHAFFKKKRVCI